MSQASPDLPRGEGVGDRGPPRTGDAARLPALDAVRGLAATAVLFGHALNLTGPERLGLGFAVDQTPIGLLVDGHLAVILFFVLSGLVLTRALGGLARTDLAVFYVRRYTRLYPPFIGVCALAWAAVEVCVQRWPQYTVSWNAWGSLGPWPAPLGLALLRGYARDFSVDSALWTLIIEFHLSLIFPVLVLATRRGSLAVPLAVVVLSLGCGRLFEHADPGQPLIWASNPAGRVLLSLYYLQDFAFGVWLALSLERICAVFRATPLFVHAVAAAALFLPPHAYLARHVAQEDGLDLLRSVYLVVGCVAWPQVSRRLATSAPLWLGRASYSLYLSHLPIMFALQYMLHDHLALAWTMALSLPVCLASAEIVRLTLEEPALRLSRRLGVALRLRLSCGSAIA